MQRWPGLHRVLQMGKWDPGSVPGAAGWSGEVQHTEASGAMGHASGSILPCQQPWAEQTVHRAGMDPAFSRGSDGMKCANPWWNMGTKICLPAACRGLKGMVRQTQLIKLAHLLLCFPFRVQIIGAVWKAKALLLQTKHSPALQPLQPNCTHSGGQAQLWGQGSCLWSVCQKCCPHDWLGGSWEPQLPVPSPLGSCRPRHVFTRVRANS